ncbi:Protein-export protein SecB [Candidatus Fokinia solitaria]|uniref:Protein-export protein SecB n=1 Tax=Candidatus Fokinia solitaria TaxID=1802984 RepID=A0A2U8BRH3_9RICK|nr:protein-export chaperone SecB [Candidatus Fokinia solitaria]AWD32956.1 Protein-export protein SecB [Candidatus Fokinia solitaria]
MENSDKATSSLEGQQVPVLEVQFQFLKDLSFESNGHYISSESPIQQDIRVSFDVNVVVFDVRNTYDVVLNCKVESMFKEQLVFVVELQYCARITIAEHVSEQDREIMLFVTTPTLLFPYVRNIVSDVACLGSYPVLLLAPFDFAALYARKKSE